MDWRDALEIEVARTHHEEYRRLTSEDHPEHEIWRERLVARAEGRPADPPTYPPILAQAANLAAAAGRVVGAVVRREPVRVPHEVYMARLDACLRCEFNGQRPYAVHCMKCGCNAAKLSLATEGCPDVPPRWERWEPSA